MSCFQQSAQHLAAVLGSSMAVLPQLTVTLAVEMANRIAVINASAVDGNYNHAEPTTPVTVTAEMIATWKAQPLSGASVRKAMQSLAYQCCDADGWETSAEGAFLGMLLAFLPAPVRGEPADGVWSISSAPC